MLSVPQLFDEHSCEKYPPLKNQHKKRGNQQAGLNPARHCDIRVPGRNWIAGTAAVAPNPPMDAMAGSDHQGTSKQYTL